MQVSENKQNRRYLLILIISTLGILYLLIQALTMFLGVVVSMFVQQGDRAQLMPMGTLAWTSLLLSLLLVPILFFSLKYWKGQPIPHWADISKTSLRKWVIGMVVPWLLLVLLGYWLVGKPTIATFFLGPINFFVMVIPIALTLAAVHPKSGGGSQLRQWGTFGFSLLVTPAIIMIIELVVIMILALVGGVWLAYKVSIDPSIEIGLMNTVNQIVSSGQDPDAVLQLLKPFVLQPAVLVWVALIFGGLTPIIEELFKPLVLWMSAGRQVSPRQGFVGGLLCGAGFALLENLLYFSMAVTPEDWLYTAIGRAGTGVLHMLGSGLIGWGLAKAWQAGKRWHLAVTLVAAFLFHGVWNVVALAIGMVPLLTGVEDESLWRQLALNSPLILLLVFCLFVLFGVKYLVKREEVQSITDSNHQVWR